MKGPLFREPGVVTLADLDTPVAGDGEVLVHIKAAGICGSDLHGVVDGMYPHPAVLGHEFAGRYRRRHPRRDQPAGTVPELRVVHSRGDKSMWRQFDYRNHAGRRRRRRRCCTS